MDAWSADIDREQLAAWLATRAHWLHAIERRCGSLRSRPEYERVWAAFYGTARGYQLAPWAVTTIHAQQWSAELSRRLAPASVNKHLSILSSFYRFAGEQGLGDANPFDGKSLRARVQRYARSRYPTFAQVVAILEQIDTSSPLGLRDRAIIGGMFATTRRVSEWLALRWSDIAGNTITVRIKGGRTLRQVAPDGLLAEITAWLTAAGHNPPAPADHLFCVPARWGLALNPGHVNHLLRRYGSLAGVPDTVCHAHGLRHAGARWRYQQGATPYQLQQVLGHRNIATTEIYIRDVLSDPEDAQADALTAFFGSLKCARIPSSRAFAPAPTAASRIPQEVTTR